MLEPSTQIASLLDAVALAPFAATGMLAMSDRASEFASPFQARLAGVALDPNGRSFADDVLDSSWSEERRRQILLDTSAGREVIIGSGVHAAAYAAVRVLSGFPRPLVLERSARVGGTFAMTARPTFYLNSRNRAGAPGLAGDMSASLNHLPGAPIQAANVSMREFQTNTDLAFVIRLALAQFADVVPQAQVLSAGSGGSAVEIEIENTGVVPAARIIDARGLGDPQSRGLTDGTTVLTFPQLMQRMSGPWPLRGRRRVAVIGGGDSGKCAVESLLGIGPEPFMASAALDQVERVDWYADTVPVTCPEWQRAVRGRYQAIGRYLRPDRTGRQRLTVLPRRVQPVALPGAALIDGQTYDLVIQCTGYQESDIAGLEYESYTLIARAGGTAVAREHDELSAYRIGPHARLPFTDQERDQGVADIPANQVSIFRTVTQTAALAATLGPADRP